MIKKYSIAAVAAASALLTAACSAGGGAGPLMAGGNKAAKSCAPAPNKVAADAVPAWNSPVGFTGAWYYNSSASPVTVESVSLIGAHNLILHKAIVYQTRRGQDIQLTPVNGWPSISLGSDRAFWRPMPSSPFPGAVIDPDPRTARRRLAQRLRGRCRRHGEDPRGRVRDRPGSDLPAGKHRIHDPQLFGLRDQPARRPDDEAPCHARPTGTQSARPGTTRDLARFIPGRGSRPGQRQEHHPAGHLRGIDRHPRGRCGGGHLRGTGPPLPGSRFPELPRMRLRKARPPVGPN